MIWALMAIGLWELYKGLKKARQGFQEMTEFYMD